MPKANVVKVAKVGIVYSESEKFSNESRNLAFYLTGLLSAQGHSDVFLVGYRPDGQPGDVSHKRITYMAKGATKPSEVPGSDVNFSHFSELNECHMVILTVNSSETASCAKKLSDLLQNRKQVVVFSLQRGVRNSNIVKEEIVTSGNIVVLEGVVGFAAVADSRFKDAVRATHTPAVMFERLSREAVKVADGPMNLLETMDMEFYFRKTLTPYSWGVLVYENLFALNALTRSSLNHTLSKSEWRLILALMNRESATALTLAARGGKWVPELLLITSMLNMWLLEMILALPGPLFALVYWFFGLYAPADVVSPLQLDLAEGRKSMASWHLSELVETGKKNNYPCTVCALVLEQIKRLESHLEVGGGSGALAAAYKSGDHMLEVEQQVRTLLLSKGGHPSVREVWYWLVRGLGVLSVVVMLLFLFLHDY